MSTNLIWSTSDGSDAVELVSIEAIFSNSCRARGFYHHLALLNDKKPNRANTKILCDKKGFHSEKGIRLSKRKTFFHLSQFRNKISRELACIYTSGAKVEHIRRNSCRIQVVLSHFLVLEDNIRRNLRIKPSGVCSVLKRQKHNEACMQRWSIYVVWWNRRTRA